ncbi:MAG TPA: sugar phosphate nucleotidyltransferase [Candidatus Saccharimonadia bacterium]|nr:sugar phosphate nucleotidyltransferase [Candidatus Saccharimonadia bacterium]
MKPTTAVIMAAGLGTRMLPVTAAVQKEMLPILNRPVIDYTVADLVAAGITRILFITRAGQTGLKDYYQGNPPYIAALKRLGKTEVAKSLAAIHAQARFEFIEQSEDAGYGTAVPLITALPHLDPSETIIYCSGDDFVWRADAKSEMTDFVTAYTAGDAEGALMVTTVPASELTRYGVLATNEQGSRHYLTSIADQPQPSQAPSRQANISKYILTPQLQRYATATTPNPNGELSITDALTSAATTHKILVHPISGTYLDTGTPAAWLGANRIVADSVLTKS